jgi:hypothetical protein
VHGISYFTLEMGSAEYGTDCQIPPKEVKKK